MRSKKIIVAVITIAVFSNLYCAYYRNKSKAPAIGVKAGSRHATFQQLLETARTEAGTKSISAAVILHDGRILRDVANEVGGTNPVSTDTLFSIGSCTKTFISACVFKLIELHKLNLDNTMQTLLYDPGILDEAYKRKIDPTIRIQDLLNHRTGIDDFLGTSYYSAIYSDPNLIWDYNKTLSYIDSPVYPYDHVNRGNNVFEYSNTNFILLGIIIEHVTGNKIVTVITQYFLTPLFMGKTFMAGVAPHWGLTSIPGQMAVGYEKIVSTWVKSSTLISKDAVAVYSSTWTCGNMVSTALEMARWAKYYYQLQHSKGYIADELFNPAAISSRYFSEKKFGYGIEYIKHRSGCELWGHTGTIIGFNNMVFYIPSQDISLAVLINDHKSDRWTILHGILEYIKTLQ